MNKKGFTLLELLVAISIFSILILSVYSAFHTGMLTHKKVNSLSGLYQRARVGLDKMKEDLENSFPYTNQDARFSGQIQGMSFFSNIGYFQNQGEDLSQVLAIEYRFNDAKLKRISHFIYDEAELKEEELLSGIEELKFNYAFKNDQEPFYAWQEAWQIKENIPQAVKIEFVLKSPGAGQGLKFERVVFIPGGILTENK
ncbi:MAG: type II secretion system protein GspJ [Candidatus Omnitrophota bacterium]